MLIACSTASFPQESLESALRRIAWAGFEGVELDLRSSEAPGGSDLQVRLRNEHLQVAAIHAGTAPLGGGEAALEEWGRIGRVAALARELDCGQIVLAAPADGDLAALREGLILLDKALGQLPVDVGVVNRAGSLVSGVDDFARLWELGVPGRLQPALDPAQAELSGWDPLDLSGLPAPPTHVYWNDLRAQSVVPPGEGELPLFALAEKLMGLSRPPRSVSVSLENADPWQVEPLAREVWRQTVIQFEPSEAADAAL